MNDAGIILVGLLLLGMGYLIGVRHNVNLVHSYHYKRVSETDMPSFCKGIGLGNVLVGIGMLLFPFLNMGFGQTISLWVTGAFVLIGLSTAIATIIRYNKGLF